MYARHGTPPTPGAFQPVQLRSTLWGHFFSNSSGLRVASGALVIALVGILCTGGAVYWVGSNTITQMATDDLSHVVDATLNMVHQTAGQAVINHLRANASTNLSMVTQLYAEYKAGNLSESQAKTLAQKTLLSQHIGTSGYIYCLDSRGIIRVHPKNTLLNADLSKFDFIQEQLRRKEGYIEYDWKNPGEKVARPKALYMLYFKPWDWIISVSSYRDEFNNLIRAQDFREDILSIKIGQTGYLYILDERGTLIVHPSLEGKNISAHQDSNGKFFIREILQKKNGKIIYSWKNPGERNARKKIVVYKYYPDFKWVIGGGAYLDELYQPLHKIRSMLLGILIGTCLLAFLLSLGFGRGIVSAQKLSEIMLRSSLETTETIIEHVPFALVLLDPSGQIRQANAAARLFCQVPVADWAGQPWATFHPTYLQAKQEPEETQIRIRDGKHVPVLLARIPLTIGNESASLVAFLDLRERHTLERELYQAQKLEAVGRLAAGIAHEINTPTQYVGDNAKFLEESFNDLFTLIQSHRAVLEALPENPEKNRLLLVFDAAETKADLRYLRENIPAAFASTQDGISRIISIVRAMKEFAHPENREKTPTDINKALQATLTIARNEYKYVADVETSFGDIPMVTCLISDLNQVFLNLLVNAAHAIGEVVQNTQTKGVIRVRTSLEGTQVRIDIEDTGAGIPESIREQIFDPFFTTKEVGKGTGQGLAIARSIVVTKHGGQITFHSDVGKGTTFTVLLPLDANTTAATPASAV